MKTVDRPPVTWHVQRKKQKRSWRLSLLLLLLFLIVGGASVFGYQMAMGDYHHYVALAESGLQHLRQGETLLISLLQHPFDTQIVLSAQHEFSEAEDTFAQVNTGVQSIPSAVTLLPVYGGHFNAAQHLLPVALGISQIGIEGCTILSLLMQRYKDPLNPSSQGLNMADFSLISQNVQQIKVELLGIVDEMKQIQPADVQFDTQLTKLLGTFEKYLPTLQQWLGEIDGLVAALPGILGIGNPANYLIEVLDSSELRPAGGFIGNYGILTLTNGRMMSTSITDVDLLDKPYKAAGNRMPYPAAYKWFGDYLAPDSWSLRDSNLDADFPTDAMYGERNYLLEGGQTPVIGVIAITPMFIEQILMLTGPITIPEYHETITAQNLIERIHFHQLAGTSASNEGQGRGDIPSSDGLSSQRKHFTALLAEKLMSGVRHLSSTALPKFIQLIPTALHTKDIQLYFNDATLEKVLQENHLAGAIQSPTGDSLFVVDANVAGNKANSFIVSTMDELVSIDNHGNVLHRLTLRYAWTLPGNIWGRSLYQDYVRIYTPPGSVLIAQDGWQLKGSGQAFQRNAWAGYFTLTFGQTRTISLVWRTPALATYDSQNWQYQTLIQHQAGTQWTVNLGIITPDCSSIKSATGGLLITQNRIATLSQPLLSDLSTGLQYTC